MVVYNELIVLEFPVSNKEFLSSLGILPRTGGAAVVVPTD